MSKARAAAIAGAVILGVFTGAGGLAAQDKPDPARPRAILGHALEHVPCIPQGRVALRCVIQTGKRPVWLHIRPYPDGSARVRVLSGRMR